MNEQQLAAVKQAIEALMVFRYAPPAQRPLVIKAITALQSIISQNALDKMAENARELGLNYDTPLSAFVRSSDEDKAEVMERVIDKAIEAQKEKIGCVNHDCDQCKAQPAVQEPVAYDKTEMNCFVQELYDKKMCEGKHGHYETMFHCVHQAIKRVTPPAAQPAVQEGRDWSLLEATQESLREHMAEIKRLKAAQPAPVQEPVAWMYESVCGNDFAIRHDPPDYAKNIRPLYITPPAAQPVPVKTYHDGQPWPVAPKPWVGLTDEDIHEQGWNLSADRDYEAWTGREFLVVNGVNDFARAIEAKLKGKNHG